MHVYLLFFGRKDQIHLDFCLLSLTLCAVHPQILGPRAAVPVSNVYHIDILIRKHGMYIFAFRKEYIGYQFNAEGTVAKAEIAKGLWKS